MANFREVHYNGYIRRNTIEGFEPMHKYKILSFNKNASFKIHIKYQNAGKIFVIDSSRAQIVSTY